MPELSRFYGMVIKVFLGSAEHNPPHIYIVYNEYLGMINIQTLELMEGDLPARALALVKEWAAEHQQQLLEIWNTQTFVKLPPLE